VLTKKRSVILLVALSSWACDHNKAYEKPLTPVAVGVVEQYSSGGGIRYSGDVEADVRVDLAFKVGGYVREILEVKGVDGRHRRVQEGDVVRRHTILARVRESDYRERVGQAKAQIDEAQASEELAKAQIAEAQASLEQAKLDFERATNLFASQSLTKPDFDASKARFETIQARFAGAKAQLGQVHAKEKEARAQLATVEIALQDCALAAPIDGVILKRNIEVGTLVGTGTPAFILADTSMIKVVFGVPDVILQNLKLGSSLTISTEAIRGVQFQGRISRISPSADPKSRVFDIEIHVPNPRQQLKVGMIAALELPTPKLKQAVPVVPLTSIVRPKDDPKGYAVFLVEEQAGKTLARNRKVRLGEAYGNRIGVVEGLRVGDRVVVNGASLINDGDQVRVLP